MKKTFLFICFAVLVHALFASEIKTDAKITDVTLYLQGATVYSNASVQIPAGTSQITITKLTQYLDANSVQVAGLGNFTILGVASQINYIEKIEQTKQIKDLEAKQKSLQIDQKTLNSEFDVYSIEERLLEKNMDLKGVNTGLQVVELEKAANFYRIRLLELKRKKLDIQGKIELIKQQLNTIDNELNQLRYSSNTPTGEVVVMVSSKTAQNIKLQLSYYVAQATWAPYYDIRVKDVVSPVGVTYKAVVNQNTGVEWDNVKLTLSTGNPSLSGTVPNLEKWILLQQNQPVRIGYGSMMKSAPTAMSVQQDNMDYELSEAVVLAKEEPVKKLKSSTPSVVVSQKTTTAEFEIDELISVQSDGKEARVTIKEHNLPANYKYVCVPKLDKDAFLVASVTGYEAYNFLSGGANLYFEGAYVGESFLQIESAQDTLQLSLGRDKGIVVERKRVDDFTAKKQFGSKRKEQQTWDIVIKNNKQIPIAIDVQDHIPISGQSEIEVSNVMHADATIQEKTGIITWKLQIDKASSKKVQVAFQITYPKDWIVNTK